MKMINTSECEKCEYGDIDDTDKRRIRVHCSSKNKDYFYGACIPCEEGKKKMPKERNNEERTALKVARGSLIIAQKDVEYIHGDNKFTLNAGDKVMVGFDGFLHPLKVNALLTIDDGLELEGYSATGLAEFLCAWLDKELDLENNLRRTMLDLDDFRLTIESGLAIMGMKVEREENVEQDGRRTEGNSKAEE